MPRRSASPHRSAHLRALTPAVVLSLLALTACTDQPEETDTRPVSSADEFFAALESLEAVESIDRADEAVPPHEDDEPDSDADGPTAHPTDPHRSIVQLGDDADSVALRVAERDIRNLYSDYRYPDGPPSISITSGDFRVEAPRYDTDSRATAAAPSGPTALNLTQLPHLAALPDVESGVLEDTQATARLHPDTDLRDWVLNNADAPGAVRLNVTVASSDSPGDSVDDPTTGADDSSAPPPTQDTSAESTVVSADPTTTRFSFSLGSQTALEDSQTLFETADAGGATLLSGSVGDRTQQRTEQGDLHVPSLDDVPALHDALVTQYGAAAQDGFSVRTDDDLILELGDGPDQVDDVLAAHTGLTDAGAAVRRIEMNSGGVAVTVDDADGLRDVVDVVSDADWPLGPEEPVEVSHRDVPHYGTDFEAQEWPHRSETIAALWDAGFTAVLTDSGSRGAHFGLTIGDAAGPDVTRPAGRDALVTALRTGDWSGVAAITIRYDDVSLSFASTATGTADSTDDGRYGEDDQRPSWAQEFLTAWDATAG